MRLLSETSRIQTASVQHDLDSFLVDQINGHLNTLPTCRDPAGVFTLRVRFRIVGKIDLCSIRLVGTKHALYEQINVDEPAR
jgi:hypothetical protein